MYRIGYQQVQTWVSTYPRESFLFIAASLINSVGSALLWPLTTIYVHNILHKSYGEAGFVLLCQSLASVFGQLLGGSLFHRLGAKRLIVGSLILAGFAQMSLIVAKAWVPYVFMMAVNGLLNAITMPAVNAFIGFRWRSHRYRLFNAVYVCNNIGVALGTTLAGLLAVISFDLTFLFDGVSTIAFGVFFFAFFKRINNGAYDNLQVDARIQGDRLCIGRLLLNYRLYLFIAIGTMSLSLATSAWNSGIAPFLNDAGLSPATYSFLWTVNGAVILFGQPLISLLNRYVTKSLYNRQIASAVFYALGFLFIMVLYKNYIYLIAGMAICTLGEMLISPTNPALITQTTGQTAPFYLGVVGGVQNLGRLIGPVLFGTLFDAFGVMPILIIATCAAIFATGSFTLNRTLQRQER